MTAIGESNSRKILNPVLSQSFHRTFAMDVLEGLSQNPKKISPAYLYDKRGSELFRQITTLDEYYITKSEHEILSTYKAEISKSLPPQHFNLIELGAGDGHKTMLLIEHFIREHFRFEYFALDIASDSVDQLTRRLEKRFSPAGLKVTGMTTEYFDGLKWLSDTSSSRNFILFLGSNIGNFDYPGALKFLRTLWDCLKPDDQLLIGFDLKKEMDILNSAYNDAGGVTRDFNMNLLDRINRDLGANFDLCKWLYYSAYQVTSGAVESYLVSTEKQEVYISDLNKAFSFEAWEPVHTESSYKYLESEILCLAGQTGFQIQSSFLDSRGYFVDSLWSVVKPGAPARSCSVGCL